MVGVVNDIIVLCDDDTGGITVLLGGRPVGVDRIVITPGAVAQSYS